MSCDTVSRLPSLMNRKFVDEFAVEFCMTMNFKGNRARLARALFNVDKNRYTHTHTRIQRPFPIQHTYI